MNNKKLRIPFRFPFLRKKKNLRQNTTDESKLGMAKSGANLKQIMQSLRAPKQMIARLVPRTKNRLSQGFGGIRPAWWCLIGSLVLVAVLVITQLAPNSFWAAGRRMNNVRWVTRKSIRTAVTDADNWIFQDAGPLGHDGNVVDNPSERVMKMLLADPQIAAREITVTTAGHLITLTGHVRNDTENQRAEQLTRAVLGLSYSVDNQLKIG